MVRWESYPLKKFIFGADFAILGVYSEISDNQRDVFQETTVGIVSARESILMTLRLQRKGSTMEALSRGDCTVTATRRLCFRAAMPILGLGDDVKIEKSG